MDAFEKKYIWSWEAAILGPIWALYNHLWKQAGFILFLYLIIPVANCIFHDDVINKIIVGCVMILLMGGFFVFGKYGNRWLDDRF